jgi:DNA-binding MarR family transcriptional regulator
MSGENLDAMLRGLKALADESRLKILGILATQECNVEEFASLLRLKAPTISHHLSRLREAGLVDVRSDGNTRFYRLRKSGLTDIRKSLGSTERVATLAEGIEVEGWEGRVLRSFTNGDELLRIPASRKKRQVILRWLVEFFKEGVSYPEKEINEELKRHHWDSATLRREFIASRLMERERGIYRRLPVSSRS